MKCSSYISRHSSGLFYFRVIVPVDLRATVGRTEIRRSLKTRDYFVALSKVGAYLRATQQYLRDLRMADDIDLGFLKNIRTSKFEIKERYLPDGSKEIISRIDPAAIEALKSAGLTGEQIAEVGKAVFAKKAVEAAAPYPTPTPTAVQPPPELEPENVNSAPLSSYVEPYLEYRLKHGHKPWQESTVLEHRPKFELLIQILGDLSVTAINESKARYFIETVRRLPRNMKKRFPDLSFDDAIAVVEQLKPENQALVSETTVAKYKQTMNGFFNYLVDEEKTIDSNPFANVKAYRSHRKTKFRRAFSTEDLIALFSVKQFTEHEYKHPFEYWTALIALFTGLRLNEVAQLHVNDIQQREGIWLINVNEDDKERTKKRLKSISSERMLPIHPHLIDLGFLNFVKGMETGDSHDRLFPELRYNTKAGFGKKISEWFNGKEVKKDDGGKYVIGGIKRQAGLAVGAGQDFHTFRATIASVLRNKHGMGEDVIGGILGHASKTVTGKHYTDPYAAKTLKPIIDELDFSAALINVQPYSTAKFLSNEERRSRKK